MKFMHLIPLIIKFYFQISLRLFAFVMCLHVGFFKITPCRYPVASKDAKGNRYCINLVSVAGLPPTV